MSARTAKPSTSSSLSKTFQVQDQIIDQLRADHLALRETLDAERADMRDARISHDKELKELQRESVANARLVKQQELKIDELQRELTLTRELLTTEQKTLKALEKEHINNVKELKLKNSKEFDKCNKQEMAIDKLKSEVETLKENLDSERNATKLLIREHNAEVKVLREQVKYNSTEAYRELKERATKERDEYKEMQLEAERTYKLLEQDFRAALADKDEDFKRYKAESKLVQKELEEQLKASFRDPAALSSSTTLGIYEYEGADKMRRLKNEVSVLKEQNRKLLTEIQSAENEKVKSADSKMEIEKLQKNLADNEKQSRVEINRMEKLQSVCSLKSDAKSVKSNKEHHYNDLKKTMLVLRGILQ